MKDQWRVMVWKFSDKDQDGPKLHANKTFKSWDKAWKYKHHMEDKSNCYECHMWIEER